MVGPDNFYVEIFPHSVDHDWKKPIYQKKVLIKSGQFEPITSVRGWEGDQFGLSAPEADPCTGSLDIQKRPNEFVLALARKYGDRVVISTDEHFGAPEEKLVQEMRMANSKESWKFFNSYHALTADDAAVNLHKQLGLSDYEIDSFIDNSYHFIEHFDKYRLPTRDDNNLLPNVPMVYGNRFEGKTNKEIFWDLVKKHDKLAKIPTEKHKEYLDRVDYELSVICDNDAGIDFLPYFFLLKDVCE